MSSTSVGLIVPAHSVSLVGVTAVRVELGIPGERWRRQLLPMGRGAGGLDEEGGGDFGFGGILGFIRVLPSFAALFPGGAPVAEGFGVFPAALLDGGADAVAVVVDEGEVGGGGLGADGVVEADEEGGGAGGATAAGVFALEVGGREGGEFAGLDGGGIGEGLSVLHGEGVGFAELGSGAELEDGDGGGGPSELGVEGGGDLDEGVLGVLADHVGGDDGLGEGEGQFGLGEERVGVHQELGSGDGEGAGEEGEEEDGFHGAQMVELENYGERDGLRIRKNE